jgi:ssDNA-binding Zn-finger/Zn-ribbon topoisomerase 1
MLKRWRQQRLLRRLASAEVPEGQKAIAHARDQIREIEESFRRSLIGLPGMDFLCPSCGSALILRTAKRGRNRGSQFWGCASWPSCTYTAGLAKPPAWRSYA